MYRALLVLVLSMTSLGEADAGGQFDRWPDDPFSLACQPGATLCFQGEGVWNITTAVATVGVAWALPFSLYDLFERREGRSDLPERCHLDPKMACPTAAGTRFWYADPGQRYLALGAERSRRSSDIVFAGALAGGTIVGLFSGYRQLLAVALSVVYTFSLTDTLKWTFRQPRPIAWITAEAIDGAIERGTITRVKAAEIISDQRENRVYLSFPSGHTSMTAAALFSAATVHVMHLHHFNPGDRRRVWLWGVLDYLVAAGVTGWVGYLRVAGGEHHWADVITGGLLGTAVGVMLPLFLLDGPNVLSNKVSFALRPSRNGIALSVGF